jgi:hypothetical protein
MKSSLLVLTAILSLGLSAHADNADNTISLNMSAQVTRACYMDFNDANAAAQLETKSLSLIQIQAGPRELAPAPDTYTVPVYETCNDDYQVSVISVQGGLKQEVAGGAGYVHEYDVSYTNADGSEHAFGSASVKGSADIKSEKVLSRPLSAAEKLGASPLFEQNNIKLSFPKSKKLAQGTYSDTIKLDMNPIP